MTTQDGFTLGLQRIPRGRGEKNGIKDKPATWYPGGRVQLGFGLIEREFGSHTCGQWI